MDKATDIGTLLEVKDWILHKYYIHEEDLTTRMVLNSLMCDIIFTVDTMLDSMYEDIKVGLDD